LYEGNKKICIMEENWKVLDEVPVLSNTAKNTRGSASGVRNSSHRFAISRLARLCRLRDLVSELIGETARKAR